MPDTKKVKNIRVDSKLRAIESHAGFISYVTGKVKKIGMETVLQQYMPALGTPTEFYWLKKAYERVLDFAEKIQIKEVPNELTGQISVVEMPMIELAGNRLEFDIGSN